MPNNIWLGILGGGVGVALVELLKSVIMFKLNNKGKSNKDITETIELLRENEQFLMYDRIKSLCKKHCDNGRITAEDLEDIMRMHELYHKLGGNGYLDKHMEQVKGLDII